MAWGIFFCEHCGTTPVVEVDEIDKPDYPCPTCGMTKWCFEPLEGEWACYCNETLPCTPSISAHCPKNRRHLIQ